MVGTDRLAQLGGLDPHHDRRALTAGYYQTIETVQISGDANLARRCPQLTQHGEMRFKAALDCKNTDAQGCLQAPRSCRSASAAASSAISRPGIASPRPIEAAATRSGSLKCVVASTIARARRSGSA